MENKFDSQCFFGQKFLTKQGVQSEQCLNDKKMYCLYFGAYWCPTSRSFTGPLREFYNNVNTPVKQLEVIYVGLDTDQECFDMHYSEMPWTAICFDDNRSNDFKHKFKIDLIPSLLVLKGSGELITKEGWKEIILEGPNAYARWEKRIMDDIKKREEIDVYDD